MIASLFRRDPEVGASTERMTSSYLEGDLSSASQAVPTLRSSRELPFGTSVLSEKYVE